MTLPIGEIVCGDCLDVMRGWPDGCIDAVITDPPFGIGFLYGDRREDHDNPGEYWDWLKPRIDEMIRLAKPGALMAVWQTQKYFPHLWDWFGRDIHIYAACKNFVQMRPTAINYGYDPVVMWYQPGTPLRPEKPGRSVDWFVADTASVVSGPKCCHPCPRPLDQCGAIIANFTSDGALILDPFAGSGTTCVAAERLGRPWIGIEIDPGYCEIARKRTAQRGLFSGDFSAGTCK
jgi:site-specific DNA-methyltransferase (adenine-specific)